MSKRKLRERVAELEKELQETKQKLKASREDFCRYEVQTVLEAHECRMVSTPAGIAILAKE